MKYTNENRGKIHRRARGQQIIDFSKIRYGNVTPTDIDGFIEKSNEAFVFYELKYADNEMPYGQETALRRLVDLARAAGKKSVLFLCRHDVSNPEDDIDASKAIVDRIYFNSEWHRGNGHTLKEASDSFMKWALPESHNP